MRRTAIGPLVSLVAVLVAITGCAAPPGDPAAQETTFGELEEGDIAAAMDRRLTQLELQSLLMGYADEHASRVGEAAERFEQELEAPADRMSIHGMKYRSIAAALSIAASPDAEVALLDMLTLVVLEKGVIERALVPRYGDRLAPVVVTYDLLLERIEGVARRVLSDKQVADVRGLANAWLERHPDVIVVSLIRFDDFIDARGASPQTVAAAEGLLADVGNATQAADKIRLMSERIFWYAMHMPWVMGLQTEATVYDILDEFEIQRLFDDTTRFASAAEELTGIVDGLPDRLGEIVAAERAALMDRVHVERTAAIDHFAAELTRQREALLGDFDEREIALRGLLEEVRLTLASGQELVATTTVTVDAVDRIVARFDEREVDPDGPPREPLDMADVRDAAVETRLALERLAEIIAQSNDLLGSPAWDDRSSQLGEAYGRFERTTNRLVLEMFVAMSGVVVIFFVALLGYRWLVRRVAQ